MRSRYAWPTMACALFAGAIALQAFGEGMTSALPGGWRIEGNELVWTSKSRLPMGGARYEFRAGKRLLGFPAQSGDTLRLRLPARDPLQYLSVWAAGRRIDAPMPATRTAPASRSEEPPAAISAVDRALPGPYLTRRLFYSLPPLVIEEFPEPVEVLGEVTAPIGDIGPMPLVLLLHGRHSTCYRGGPGGPASGDWPCPEGWRPVPSQTGYRYITDVLASQGYLAVSIAANGINAQDGLFADGGAFARSRLVRHHLAQWAAWSDAGGDPWSNRFQGRVDLERVVLVGHSRGGEGVERATIDTNAGDRWKIQGLLLIGPTAFGRQAAAGVHTAVILPHCDGDVSDLQGQQYVDIGRDLAPDPALRSSIMALGTNHNFFNTEWTPGLSKSPAWDDWYSPGDPQCGEHRERRLTPDEQQAVGLAYAAALVDLAVGDVPQSLPLLDGTRVKPASIGRARTVVHAIGGDKRLLYAAGHGTRVQAASLTTRVCRGYFLAGPFDLRPGCTPRIFFELTPHWSPMAFAETAPAPRAHEVRWESPGGSVVIPVDPGGAPADALDLRVAGDPSEPPVEFNVRVRDAHGNSLPLGQRPLKLYSYFGLSPLGKVVARQLRARPHGGAIDLGSITAIELVPASPRGRFWLLDVSTWRDSLAASDQLHLPRVSVGDLVVPEGDNGPVTIDVPISIEGAVAERAQVWVQLTDYASFEQPARGFPLVLEPGATSASFPFTFVADDMYNPFPQVTQVTLMARGHAVTGKFDGSVLLEEDDPPPVLAVDASHVTGAEGAGLRWTFRLSEALANGAFWPVEIRPAAGRFAELDTNDVTPEFLRRFGIEPPDPAVPLSALGIGLHVEFTPGERVTHLRIPISADGVMEGTEGVVLLLDGFGDPVVPVPIELTGTVAP